MALLRNQKEDLEAKLRKTSEYHEKTRRDNGESTQALAALNSALETKEYDMVALRNAIAELRKELKEKDKEILASKTIARKLVVGNMMGTSILSIKEGHKKELENQRRIHEESEREHEEIISTLMEVHNGEQKKHPVIPGPQPAPRRGWSFPKIFQRPQSQTPKDDQLTREYNNFIRHAHHNSPYNGNARNYDDRNLQIFNIADKMFREKYPNSNPDNLAVDEDLSKHFNIKRPPKPANTQSHFTFNSDNNNNNVGRGGLYCARM